MGDLLEIRKGIIMENENAKTKNKFILMISIVCSIIIFLVIYLNKGSNKDKENEKEELNNLKNEIKNDITGLKQYTKDLTNESKKKLDEFNKKVEEKLNGKSRTNSKRDIKPSPTKKKKGTTKKDTIESVDIESDDIESDDIESDDIE